MMPLTLAARLGTNICCFLYPAYASYKALSAPDSSPEGGMMVERWLMYWAVVGTWTAVESVAGWIFTWLPFYSVIKFGVFLYLSLPQSEGSSYIYRTHLAPLFTEHERDIDALLFSLRGRASEALTGGAGWLWEKVRAQISGVAPVQGQAAPASSYEGYDLHQQYPSGPQQPPSLQDPASGAAQQLYGFMSKYAGQYMPLAVSAISAAAAATQRNTQARSQRDVSEASQVPETMSMPVPRPNAEATDPNLRSRTYNHAQSQSYGSITPPGVSSSRSSRNFLGQNVALSQRSSQESVHSRSSGNGSRNASRADMGSFEQIQRDEASGAAEGVQRPEMAGRTSSWFRGWGGTPERQKAE